MLLPNGDRAIVDIRKLRDYCLNADSARGKTKARVFASALGIRAGDALSLRNRLLEAARTTSAQPGELDNFGQRYSIDFEMQTDHGKAVVRSGWIILIDEEVPRLTTCFVQRSKR